MLENVCLGLDGCVGLFLGNVGLGVGCPKNIGTASCWPGLGLGPMSCSVLNLGGGCLAFEITSLAGVGTNTFLSGVVGSNSLVGTGGWSVVWMIGL